MDWNAVAIPGERCFGEARRFLQAFGAVQRTAYLNVLAVRTADPPRAFLEALAGELERDPGRADLLVRVAPCEETFLFQDPAEFDARAREAALAHLDALLGQAFYVRVHRRGFKRDFERLTRERLLGQALLEAAAARGVPAKIRYDDPDRVVALEMIDGRAGLTVWTREDLARFPLLRPS